MIEKKSKLTVNDIFKIRDLLIEARINQTEIARRFNVTPTTIGDIKSGRTWKNLKGKNES